ncbi:MAG: hypothetical protein ACMUIU_04750 [bacterium]
MDTIPVLVEEPRKKARTLDDSGFFETMTSVRNIDVNKLKQSIGDLSTKISSIFHDIHKVGEYRLQEIQISVEISAEGGISLVGTLKGGARGAVTLTFGPEHSK